MTSNEDAEIRKHGYKPLKRRSPTPLYYPLPGFAATPGVTARGPKTGAAVCVVHGVRARRGGVAREGEGAQFDSDHKSVGSDCKFGCRAIA